VLKESEISELVALCSGGVSRDVELSELSYWKIGGTADLILRPSSTEEVVALLTWFSDRVIRPVVIGLTTNLLFDDAGLRAPCIQIGNNMAHLKVDGVEVSAGAGAWVPMIARTLLTAGLSGVEHTCGIPGSLGGLICMNGGSKRHSIAKSIDEVVSVDQTGSIHRRRAAECGFGYRDSIFQNNEEIICEARLKLTQGDQNKIRAEMRRILADRRQKFPRKEPNCGSVFKSDPVMYEDVGPPGRIIERLGYKGKKLGAAMVSLRHANFIVNTGGASASDVLELIESVANAVEVSTGHRMRAEVRFVKEDGTVWQADQVGCL
jgi:UDP-N-acetylmuramate dehydrogenase